MFKRFMKNMSALRKHFKDFLTTRIVFQNISKISPKHICFPIMCKRFCTEISVFQNYIPAFMRIVTTFTETIKTSFKNTQLFVQNKSPPLENK
jgi:hypothetical protein